MYVREVYDLFRQYADEPDPTFLTPTQAELYLAIGYNRFRSRVLETDPHYFIATYDAAVTSSTFSLVTPGLLGNATPRLYRLLEVVKVDAASGNVVWPFVAVSTETELAVRSWSYLLEGTNLRFSGILNDTVRLIYNPRSLVDWTKIASTDTELIDDLVDFHDMIAMEAYRHYAIRDWAANPMLELNMKERRQELDLYLATGRVPDERTHISTVTAHSYHRGH